MRRFSEFLQDVREGDADYELAGFLRELSEQVSVTGKVGTLAYTIKVLPGGDGKIIVKDTIKLNLPEPERPSTLFFPTSEGDLSRRDPRQYSLDDLKVADQKVKPVLRSTEEIEGAEMEEDR